MSNASFGYLHSYTRAVVGNGVKDEYRVQLNAGTLTCRVPEMARSNNIGFKVGKATLKVPHVGRIL